MQLMYINGQFTKGNSKDVIEVENPVTQGIADAVPHGKMKRSIS